TIGDTADAGMQLPIGRFLDLAVVGFEDDGGLIGIAVFQVDVQAVLGDVQFAILEPGIERRSGLIENFGKWLAPLQVFLGMASPETIVVALCLIAKSLVTFHTRNRGARDNFARRRKHTAFNKNGIYGGRHN